MKNFLALIGGVIFSLGLIGSFVHYDNIKKYATSKVDQYIEQKVETEVQEQLERNNLKKKAPKIDQIYQKLVPKLIPSIVTIIGEYVYDRPQIRFFFMPGDGIDPGLEISLEPEAENDSLEDSEEFEDEEYDIEIIEPEEPQTRKFGGSGFFISKKGHIMTCAHLFPENYETKLIELVVYVNDGSKEGLPVIAEILGISRDADLALIKLLDYKKSTPAMSFRHSKYLKLGDKVLVIGNPLLRFGWTIVDGVISGFHRTIRIENIEYHNMIHSNALIGPGNSGGPMVDLYGRVVGIAAAYNYITQHSFYVPSEDALKFIEKYNLK